MLVLSRRESEQVLIPELGITLEVVRIKGNSVRIGIDAPREIRVLRGEMCETRSDQNAELSTSRAVDYAHKNCGQPQDSIVSRKEIKTAVRESRVGYVCKQDPKIAAGKTDEKIAC